MPKEIGEMLEKAGRMKVGLSYTPVRISALAMALIGAAVIWALSTKYSPDVMVLVVAGFIGGLVVAMKELIAPSPPPPPHPSEQVPSHIVEKIIDTLSARK